MQDESYKSIRSQLRRKISEELSLAPTEDDTKLKALISDEVHLSLLGQYVDLRRKRALMDELFHALRGLDVLQPLMEEDEVTEIMVNGPQHIFVERRGQLQRCPISFDDEQHLREVIVHFFSTADRSINLSHPIADLRLPDGSRANAVLPPLAPDGPILTIRKFSGIRPSTEALLASGFIGERELNLLKRAVQEKESIFICGGTGSGKTTLLNILSNYIPQSERVVTIEDSAELQLQGLDNLVRLECRTAGPEGGAVDIGSLIRTALRMRPDRIIVGEVRGPEAFDLLSAMNSGHPGTLCTGHANSCRDMLRRLTNMVLSASRLPYQAILENLAASIQLLVHLKRRPDGLRQVAELYRVRPLAEGSFELESCLG